MKPNRTKRLLNEGRAVLGTFCFFPSPWVVEIVGLAGLDFVIIDLEHAAKDIDTVESMVRAAEINDVTAIVRVASADEKHILQVLETGAQGIMVPLVDSAATASRAVAAAKYPPLGTRGVCRSTRAAQFGMAAPKFAEFAQSANDEMMVIAMIEEPKGVQDIAAILDTGIDGVMLGPADLSGALGVMGQLDHPKVREAADRVTSAVLAHPTAWMGGPVFTDDDVARAVSEGQRLLVYGIDTQMLSRSYATAVSGARSRIAANAPST